MTMVATEPVALLATDRCDCCFSAALGVALKDDLELMFCLHHLKQYRASLESNGWDVYTDDQQIAALTNEIVNA